MKKKEFEEFCLEHARFARAEMIEKEGSFRQQAVMVDLRGRLHIVFFEQVLHGYRMRDTLKVMALAAGGADAFVIMSDARFKQTTDLSEEKRVRQAAARGEYIVADDPANPEVLMTFGRSREHLVSIFQPYQREVKPGGSGCIITFEDPEPKLVPADYHAYTDMIPNLWERVH